MTNRPMVVQKVRIHREAEAARMQVRKYCSTQHITVQSSSAGETSTSGCHVLDDRRQMDSQREYAKLKRLVVGPLLVIDGLKSTNAARRRGWTGPHAPGPAAVVATGPEPAAATVPPTAVRHREMKGLNETWR